MTDTTSRDEAQTAELVDARLKARRAESARSPRGPLALVNTQWIDSAQTIWGVPGTWAPLPGGASGLLLVATPADGIVVDGDLVDGQVIVAGADAVVPSSIVFDEHTTGTVVKSATGAYGLRVWDAQSEAIAAFGGIDAFGYRPDWLISARYTPNAELTTVGFEHSQGKDERAKVIPGEISFDHDGTEYTVVAFPDGDRLQLVFGDTTNGDSTYSVGRFLFVAPDDDGTITLDFNRAVLPPCAFSYNFNCPIPPHQNRLPFAIEAGEKNVLATDGGLLH